MPRRRKTVKKRSRLLDAVKSARLIVIVDNTTFDPGMPSDGGRYQFSTHWRPCGGGRFIAEHRTSAIFPYCPRCGRWGDCRLEVADEDGQFEIYGCGETIFSLEKMVNHIVACLNDKQPCDYIDGPRYRVVIG